MRAASFLLAGSMVAAGMASLLGGCEGYTYKLNERVVYDTLPLFDDYEIADAALRECVAQAIADGNLKQAGALEQLNCSNAGISDLAGIETFSGLRRLGLDDNAISDPTPLYALRKLELLQLRNNRLHGISTQFCTTPGVHIALSGNSDLDCEALRKLGACGAVVVDRPGHCPD